MVAGSSTSSAHILEICPLSKGSRSTSTVTGKAPCNSTHIFSETSCWPDPGMISTLG